MSIRRAIRPEAVVSAAIAKEREDYMSNLQTLRALANMGFDELFTEPAAVSRNIVAIRRVLEQLMVIDSRLQALEDEWIYAKPEV